MGVGAALRDADALAVAEADGVTEDDALAEAVAEALGDALRLADVEPEGVGVADVVGAAARLLSSAT